MLAKCEDLKVVVDFCRKDPIRFRAVLHNLDPVCPEWDEAIRNFGRSPEYIEKAKSVKKPAPVFYCDSLDEAQLLMCIDGTSLRLEGDASKVTPEEIRRLNGEVTPKNIATTSALLKDSIAEAYGHDDWVYSRQYTTTTDTFVPNVLSPVQTLHKEDRELWKRFVERHPKEGMVTAGVGGSGAGTRDFEFMCAGMPVDYYVAIEERDAVGFLSVNPFTKECDEISALFVDPVHRRKGIAQTLLSVATQHILSHGRQPGYFAGGGGEDLDRMLKKCGYFLVSEVWSVWTWD